MIAVKKVSNAKQDNKFTIKGELSLWKIVKEKERKKLWKIKW